MSSSGPTSTLPQPLCIQFETGVYICTLRFPFTESLFLNASAVVHFNSKLQAPGDIDASPSSLMKASRDIVGRRGFIV